ncbi:MAG: hypothetical protein LUF27_05595 [Lachnospiraceae bacterium]|nr:hypothetical protein [Lachnospiraceae bacterium]
MPNCNFAVRTNEEIKKRGDALILRLQKPGENQGAALDREWDIIEQHLEASRLKAERVDIEGLDSACTMRYSQNQGYPATINIYY